MGDGGGLSVERHKVSIMRRSDPVARSYAITHPAGEVRLPTQPGWDQIIYAKSGVVVARTDLEAWTVPADRALCVGDGTQVRLKTNRPTAIRSLYLRTELGAFLRSTRVINLTTLLRELLLRAVELCPVTSDALERSALFGLLLEELANQPTAELQLPIPADPRALDLADSILADPAQTLVEATRGVGASRRTLERLFASQIGMSLARWQRRARMLAAVELMSTGQTVTASASAVGYATPSSFVAAFVSELGQTPRAFMQDRD